MRKKGLKEALADDGINQAIQSESVQPISNSQDQPEQEETEDDANIVVPTEDPVSVQERAASLPGLNVNPYDESDVAAPAVVQAAAPSNTVDVGSFGLNPASQPASQPSVPIPGAPGVILDQPSAVGLVEQQPIAPQMDTLQLIQPVPEGAPVITESQPVVPIMVEQPAQVAQPIVPAPAAPAIGLNPTQAPMMAAPVPYQAVEPVAAPAAPAYLQPPVAAPIAAAPALIPAQPGLVDPQLSQAPAAEIHHVKSGQKW